MCVNNLPKVIKQNWNSQEWNILITSLTIIEMWWILNPNPTESDTFQNPKSIGYLKSDRVGFKIFVSVQLYKPLQK